MNPNRRRRLRKRKRAGFAGLSDEHVRCVYSMSDMLPRCLMDHIEYEFNHRGLVYDDPDAVCGCQKSKAKREKRAWERDSKPLLDAVLAAVRGGE